MKPDHKSTASILLIGATAAGRFTGAASGADVTRQTAGTVARASDDYKLGADAGSESAAGVVAATRKIIGA